MADSLAGLWQAEIESDLFFQLPQEFVGLMFAPGVTSGLDRPKLFPGCQHSAFPGESINPSGCVELVVSHFRPMDRLYLAKSLHELRRISFQNISFGFDSEFGD